MFWASGLYPGGAKQAKIARYSQRNSQRTDSPDGEEHGQISMREVSDEVRHLGPVDVTATGSHTSTCSCSRFGFASCALFVVSPWGR